MSQFQLCHQRDTMKVGFLLFWAAFVVTLVESNEGLPSISFANIRDFITRLQNINANTEPKKTSSYDNIKSNLQKLKTYSNNHKLKASQKQDSIELPGPPISTRPPYMYLDQSTTTALPQSLLASMVFDRLTSTRRTTTTTTTTTTSTPFSMPTFFGAALTASPSPPMINPDPEEDVEPIGGPTKFHHVHTHHFNSEESPDDIQKWYMQHMSQILTSSAEAAASEIIPRPSRMPMTTTTTMARPTRPIVSTSQKLETCPAHCACACPSNPVMDIMDVNETKKLDLDLTLLPCARTAAYQLDLALRLCKKK